MSRIPKVLFFGSIIHFDGTGYHLHLQGGGIVSNEAKIGNKVWIGMGSIVHKLADIGTEKGDQVTIGRFTEIGSGAIIDGGCVIGDHVTIGNDCHLGRNVKIIDGAEIGDRASIEEGTIVGGKFFEPGKKVVH